MKTRKQQGTKGVQLSLFDTDMRDKTDRELIAELTPHPDQVAEGPDRGADLRHQSARSMPWN